MFEKMINHLALLIGKLNNPVFHKEYEGPEKLIAELEKIREDIDNKELKAKIDQDIAFIKYGAQGEKNVSHELRNSFLPILVLHDICIKHEDYKVQMDYIVITHSFICILETKKLSGDIAINSDGDFIRSFKNKQGKVFKKEGMYSPISQNQMQVRILKDLLIKQGLIKHLPVESLVVIANPKSIVNTKYAKKDLKKQITKYDQLTPKLKSMLKTYEKINMSLAQVKKISEFLLEKNCENVNNLSENGFVKKYRDSIKTNEVFSSEKAKCNGAAESARDKMKIIKEELIQFRLYTSRKEGIKACDI